MQHTQNTSPYFCMMSKASKMDARKNDFRLLIVVQCCLLQGLSVYSLSTLTLRIHYYQPFSTFVFGVSSVRRKLFLRRNLDTTCNFLLVSAIN